MKWWDKPTLTLADVGGGEKPGPQAEEGGDVGEGGGSGHHDALPDGPSGGGGGDLRHKSKTTK